MGLEMLPPDVNTSDADFGVASETSVSFGLVAIRGWVARRHEPLSKSGRRTGPTVICLICVNESMATWYPRSALETLIKAGGLDKLAPEGNRAALMIALPGAVQEAASLQEDRKRGPGQHL